MFARTERLLLRPGWAEDAPALARAIADEQPLRQLATAPWPCRSAQSSALFDQPQDGALPSFLVYLRTARSPVLVGTCALVRRHSGRVELSYWIVREHWGQGYASEAGRALIDIAIALGIDEVEASHFLDDAASARVLDKLGFMPTGIAVPRYSCIHEGDAPARLLRRQLRTAALEQPLAA